MNSEPEQPELYEDSHEEIAPETPSESAPEPELHPELKPDEPSSLASPDIVSLQPEVVRPPRRNLAAGRAERAALPDQAISGGQLSSGRAAHWHQQDNALLSQDALKEWIARAGLVLYAPRAQPLGAPAPTFVEATLGRSSAAPELAELEAARALLARLVAEGAVVPLNLLGVTGGLGTDTPDFVCSAAVFSFIFTLRGNKAWKTPPATAGAVKVSPLALAAYELLAGKVTLSAYDLTTQLGKEVTEAAVLRALTELWSQLRVVPVPQVDGSATLWELASTRFVKQIKSGTNAGQPTALSALISLYLGQVLLAEESEIETFLSPLAARSRVRDVLHALLGARQLETLVIDGKTLLHITGEVPAFAPGAGAEVAQDVDVKPEAGSDAGSRIKKFAGKPGGKIGTGLRSRPAGTRPNGARPSFGKPAFGRAPGGDRERRPFRRDAAAPGADRGAGSGRPPSDRPRFNKPWEENRPARAGGDQRAPRAPRRDFAPRPEGGGEGEVRPPRTFSKPGTFGRKREGAPARPSFGRPAGGAERPERRGAGDDRATGGGFKRAGSFSPRPPEDGDRREFRAKPAFGSKPRFDRERPAPGGAEGDAPRKPQYRKFDAPRGAKPFGAKPFGAKPTGAKPFPPGSGTDRPFDPERPRPASGPRSTSGSRPPFGSRPASGDRPSFGAKRSFDGPRGEGRPGFSKRPGGAGGDRPAFKRSTGRPAGPTGNSPFAKFADGGKRPFRKAGPGSRGGSSSAPRNPGRKLEGGFQPTPRKRDDGGEQA